MSSFRPQAKIGFRWKHHRPEASSMTFAALYKDCTRRGLSRDNLLQSGKAASLLATAQAQDQMECRFLLDVVVRQSATVLELLAGKDEALLIRGNALLLDVVVRQRAAII